MIKLIDLAKIFMIRLGLNDNQAITFARFLIEDSDEQKDGKVDYNPD